MRQIHIVGRRVKGIGLGTAQFAFRDATAEDSIATVHAALDAGVMLIDTALAYTRAGIESYAENVVARAVRDVMSGRPVIATKGGHWRENAEFPIDGRPETLRAHCEIKLDEALAVARIETAPGSANKRRTSCRSSAPADLDRFATPPPVGVGLLELGELKCVRELVELCR